MLTLTKEKLKVYKVLSSYCSKITTDSQHLPYDVFCKIWNDKMKQEFRIPNPKLSKSYQVDYIKKGSLKYQKNGKCSEKIKRSIRIFDDTDVYYCTDYYILDDQAYETTMNEYNYSKSF